VVVTDYYAHQIWVAPGIRHLFVATEEIKQALGKKHSSVIVSGIPIHPRFLKQKNHPQLLLKFKIANQSPVVLFLSGGNGLVDTSKTVEYILKEYSNLTIIAISGKGNETLYQKLIGLPHGKNDYRVFKFLDNIDEWMRIANIIVTKPGGLTVTECLYLKKPMLLLNPIPGQEEKNAQYVTTQHFGKLVNNPKELVSSIKLLLENPSMFKTPPSLPNPNEVIFNQS
jgi:processive 1,2-diacylglycerol beta-glucosyltransferase